MPETRIAILEDDSELEYVVEDNPPRGGMKYTYFTPDKKFAVQFFNDPADANSPIMRDRLEKIVGRYNPTLSADKGGAPGNSEQAAEYFSKLFCWPVHLIKSPEFGIVCPTYPQNFFFNQDSAKKGVPLSLAGKDKKSKWFTSSVSKYVADKEKGNFTTMLRISISLARAVRRLHAAGLSHSDLSSNNVLIDPVSGSCVVIDIDSLVVPGMYPPEVAGTAGYIAPEVLETGNLKFGDSQKKLPCAMTDRFAMAVLIYEYLFKRHPLIGPKIYSQDTEEDDFLAMGPKATFIENPFDTSNRPDDLILTIKDFGRGLEKLFLKTFVDGLHEPTKRPSAAEWEHELVKTWDLLQPCTNSKCPEGWFILHDVKNPVCPFCGKSLRRENVMHLKLKKQMAGRRGQWQQIGEINLYDQMPLFNWHFLSDCFPDEKVQDRNMKAYISCQNNQWYLVNQGLTGMLSPTGNLVPVGKAIHLQSGNIFKSCNSPNALLVEVVQ